MKPVLRLILLTLAAFLGSLFASPEAEAFGWKTAPGDEVRQHGDGTPEAWPQAEERWVPAGSRAEQFFSGTLEDAGENGPSAREQCRINGWLNYDTTSGCTVAARNPVTPEIYQASLRRFNTPNTTAAGRWEIANTGRYNYTVTGGGTKLDVDGIIGTTIQEAKFISNPGSSPFIRGSKVPDFLRRKIVGQVDDEFARMSRIIADPSNPLRDVEVIINNPAAERFFLDMLVKHGLNGRVIIR